MTKIMGSWHVGEIYQEMCEFEKAKKFFEEILKFIGEFKINN